MSLYSIRQWHIDGDKAVVNDDDGIFTLGFRVVEGKLLIGFSAFARMFDLSAWTLRSHNIEWNVNDPELVMGSAIKTAFSQPSLGTLAAIMSADKLTVGVHDHFNNFHQIKFSTQGATDAIDTILTTALFYNNVDRVFAQAA